MASKKVDKIKINSGIKVYAIENERGEIVAEMKLDTSDNGTLGRFLDLHDRMTEVADELDKKLENSNFEGIEDEKEIARMVDSAQRNAINEFIDAINKMFGRNFIQNVLKEHYEINPEYLPSVDVLLDFFGQVMPLIKSVYSDSTRNYSVKKG